MTIRYVRPLLPIELEKTRETPAIGMPVVLKSSGHVAVPLPTTPPHFSSLPVPLKQEWAERQNRDGADIVTRADVAEYVKIIGPAGSYAVFRALPGARTSRVMALMERRERVVFVLLDGKRTLQDVARLIHRSELDIARILVLLLKQQYIEYIGT